MIDDIFKGLKENLAKHEDAFTKLTLAGMALAIVPREDLEGSVCILTRYLKLEKEVVALNPEHQRLASKEELREFVLGATRRVQETLEAMKHTAEHLKEIEDLLQSY